MQNIILVPILCVLIGWLIHIRYKEVCNKRDHFRKEHSGFKARIEDCEDNVRKLWDNWNGMQKLTLGIFIAISLNLLGVIFVLVRTWPK